MTNAEKIRQMTDEELAKTLCFGRNCNSVSCPGYDMCEMGDGPANGLVKWLQRGVEE